jgi:hypothetical protein
MGIAALILHKHRTIALISTFMVLGLGIVIGWIDPWVIVLLAIGGGIWIWRTVVGAQQRG